MSSNGTPNGKRPKGPIQKRKEAQKDVRDHDILILWLEGHYSHAMIGEMLGLTKQRVGQIINELMREVRREKKEMAEFGLERELAMVDMEMREMVKVLATPCVACHGEAEVDVAECESCGNRDDMKPTCERCGGRGMTGKFCSVCNLTGNFYDVEYRMRAVDRIQKSSDRRAKLLGLYAPQKVELPVDRDFYADLEKIPDDELTRELEALLYGADAGRRLDGRSLDS